MSEQDKALRLQFDDGQEFLMNRHNSKLHTFLGSQLMDGVEVQDISTRSHVFLTTGALKDGVQMGTFIFAHNPTYPSLVGFMAEHDFPMDLNANEVPESDEVAFRRSLESIGESSDDLQIPDDWTTDGS